MAGKLRIVCNVFSYTNFIFFPERLMNMIYMYLQVGYVVGICGCIILFGIILNALLVRQQEDNDVSLTSLIVWPSLSLLLGAVYMLLWIIVFKAWKKIRRRARHNQVFTIFT